MKLPDLTPFKNFRLGARDFFISELHDGRQSVGQRVRV